MDITIRCATQDEIPLLVKLDELIYVDPPDAFSEKDFADPYYLNFLIFLDGKPIGSTVLAPNRNVSETYTAPLPKAEGSLYIISTALLPEFQRKGLGSVVKAWQIAYARINGFNAVVTNTRVSNAASIALNQKFGLRVIESIPDYYTNPTEDTLVLKLDI